MENKRLQLSMMCYYQINHKTAQIPGGDQLAVIVTCVSIIVHSEGPVAMLTVSQRG